MLRVLLRIPLRLPVWIFAAARAVWSVRPAFEDAALVACYALIAVGVGWIYRPAGLIVGGVLGAATVLLQARGAQASEVVDELRRRRRAA